LPRSPHPAAPSATTRAPAVEARALRLEREGDAAGAVAVFEAALAAAPQDPELLCGLARLAERIQSAELALGCWTLARAVAPARLEAIEGAARCLGQLGRGDEAMELLRAALRERPDAAGLWTTLGALANEQADTEGALICFGEAARLDPKSAAARYNRGGVHMERGDLAAAAEDFQAASKLASSPAQRATAQLADAFVKLCEGRIEEGWRGYEARLSPHRPDGPIFRAPGRRWTPEAKLDGARLLVLGEQGVGDQIMFASLLPDVLAAVGPRGGLSVALDPRLAGLVGRSLPGVDILPLATELVGGRAHHRAPAAAGVPPNVWAPIASLPQRFRRRLEDFPDRSGFLVPDPDAVARWRAWLGEGPPAVGLSWRSRAKPAERRRAGADLAAWRPILQTPGVRFVALQYGQTAGELEEARALAAGEVLAPPGLDLFNDLDGLAALCVALDLVVATPNATGLLAAACGAPAWLLDSPLTWRRLGTGGYPWHPRARSFPAAAGGNWEAAIAAIAAELRG
jgi:Flp pilus assembly protein TadD